MKLRTSNNEDEYEALLHGMRMAKVCNATRLVIYGDSNLFVQQTMNEFDAHIANMIAYHALSNHSKGTSTVAKSGTLAANEMKRPTSLPTSAPPDPLCHQESSSNKSVCPPSI